MSTILKGNTIEELVEDFGRQTFNAWQRREELTNITITREQLHIIIPHLRLFGIELPKVNKIRGLWGVEVEVIDE